MHEPMAYMASLSGRPVVARIIRARLMLDVYSYSLILVF